MGKLTKIDVHVSRGRGVRIRAESNLVILLWKNLINSRIMSS